jgi:hypothetical protein
VAEDEPTRSRIAVEIVWFAVIVVLVGAVFVALRVRREGSRVLNYDVRAR